MPTPTLMEAVTSRRDEGATGTMMAPVAVLALACQGGILFVTIVALRRRDFAAVVNGLGSLLASLLPAAIGLTAPLVGPAIFVDPLLTLWIALAGLLHSYGMLGPYDSIRWWDSLTHTLSAALVAALFYAAIVVGIEDTGAFGMPGESVLPLTVALTLLAGVFWEVIELVARAIGEHFDVEPVLVHYGWRDTAEDLGFDVVGALVVVLLDVRVFVPLARRWPDMAATLVVWSGVTFTVGSAALGLALLVRRRL